MGGRRDPGCHKLKFGARGRRADDQFFVQRIAFCAGRQQLAQKLQGRPFVYGPVAGAAFGRMHAGGAAVLAGAGCHGFIGGFQQGAGIAEGLAREASAAGQAVVNKHGGQPQLRVHGRGYAAKVVAVGHDEQGQHADGSVLQRVDAAHKVHEVVFHLRADIVENDKPQAFGFKNLRRGVQGRDGQQAVTRCGALLIARDGVDNAQAAPAHQHAAQRHARCFLKNVRGFLAACAGKPAHLGLLGHDAGTGRVHVVNDVAAPPVQVDSAGMRFAPGAKAVHRTDDVALLVFNAEGLACAAQIHMPLGALARGHELAAVRRLQQQALGIELAGGGQGGGARQHGFAGAQGHFGGGAFQMSGQDDLVVRVDHGLFRRAAEKIFGISGKVLVQRVLARHNDHGGFLLRPPHAAATLQGGHDRAGITHQDADIQPADVDAQFKGAGADHGQQVAAGHARFDAAALLRQKACAIG